MFLQVNLGHQNPVNLLQALNFSLGQYGSCLNTYYLKSFLPCGSRILTMPRAAFCPDIVGFIFCLPHSSYAAGNPSASDTYQVRGSSLSILLFAFIRHRGSERILSFLCCLLTSTVHKKFMLLEVTELISSSYLVLL